MTKLKQAMGVVSFPLFLSVSAMAQEPAASEKTNENESRPEARADRVEVDSDYEVTNQTDIQKLRAEIDALRAEIQSEKAKREQLSQEHAARLDELDSAVVSISADEKRFLIYGFFDLSLSKYIPDENSVIKGLAPEETSFVMSNLNLYFRSEIAQTLSSLIELRFTFLPLGHESSFELDGVSEYERTDTTVTEPNSYKKHRLGGVGIERAHLTWQPQDFFGILAGYFLTPYGIWNIDHGTPTLIPVREPYMQFSEIVPLHQLGLQLFGRIWPSQSTYLDYAVTVSNGRGPMDAVHDLDENKGLGLRLRAVTEIDVVSFGIGGYGYYGDYTDIKKTIARIAPDFQVRQEVIESYSELIGALDLLLEVYGARLQVEYVRRLNQYTDRPPRSMTSAASGGYQPDYINQSAYGLLAYTLPLHDWLGQMTLTPYFEIDYSNSDDTVDDAEAIIVLGGLNFKPSSQVVLKVEGGAVNSLHSSWLDSVFINGQMAVSF